MLATLAVYVHNISPYALKLWEGGPIRWYGLSYLLGFVIAYFLMRRVTKVGGSPVKPEQVSDLIVALALGVLLGGRLGYIAFYDRSLLWDFSGGFPWWGVLALNRGGMASHGGIIGVILASGFYARRHHLSWAHVLDLAAFATPIGLGFGRIANFVNGELIGRPAPADLAWAVKFPQEMENWNAAHLLKLQEAVAPYRPVPAGVDVLTWLQRDQVPWVIQQIQHGNQAITAAVAPLLTPRHPSQLYEALLEGLVVFVVLALVWLKPRKPLVLGGAFAATYGVVRILAECFREPDFQLRNQEFARWHVTRGQWLSALLTLAGFVLIYVASRRQVAPLGGWWGREEKGEERRAKSEGGEAKGEERRAKGEERGAADRKGKRPKA